jgi:energy-coupling factor transporter ATP-binding protein EcfA2
MGVITLGLAEGTEPFMLDGRPVIFSESSQKLYELNESAAGLVARLIEPTTFDEILAELGQGNLSARKAIVAHLVDWFDRGIVDVLSVDGQSSLYESPSKHLPIGNLDIEIKLASDRFGRSVGAPYRHLPRRGASDLVVEATEVEGLMLLRAADNSWSIADPTEAGPALRSLILNELLKLEDSIKLHVACLNTHGGAILLCGSPGAGKSTLAAFLARSGFDLAGDDIAVFDPTTGMIMGVALPLTLKGGSWPFLIDGWPEITEYPIERRKDDVRVRYLPIPKSSAARWSPVRAIIDLDRSEAAPVSMLSWSKVDCLQMLLGEAHSSTGICSHRSLQKLMTMVEGAEIFRLSYGEAEEAGRFLEQHFSG